MRSFFWKYTFTPNQSLQMWWVSCEEILCNISMSTNNLFGEISTVFCLGQFSKSEFCTIYCVLFGTVLKQ